MKINKLDKNLILIGICVSLYILYFSLISIIKFNSFRFNDFDLAVHDLTVWNILHGSIFNSILGVPFLGNHMQLILFLIAPIYALSRHPLTLLLLQTIVLGLTAIPLYRLSEPILSRNWSLVVIVVYLLYPALGYTNLYEFHPTVFATLFLTLTFFYYEHKSFAKCLIFMALSMLCQENIPLAIIMFGILAILNRRPLKWVVLPILMGGVYLFIILKAMPFFNKQTIQFISIYQHLGETPRKMLLNLITHPEIFINTLLRWKCLVYLLLLFLPLSFIPLFSPATLIPALPFFLQHMLSARLSELEIYYHYAAEIIPFIFISYIFGIKFILKKFARIHSAILKIALVAMLLFNAFYVVPYFKLLLRLIPESKRNYLDDYKDGFLKKVPPCAPIVATFEFLSHLSHRKSLYSFHHVYTGFFTLSNKRYELPEDVQYALIDFSDYRTFKRFYSQDGYKNIQRFLSRNSWKTVDYIENIVLFKKNTEPAVAICSKLQNPETDIQNKIQLNIEDKIELIGYNLNNAGKENILEIIFYYRCLKPSNKDIDLFLDITDADDNLIVRKIHPLCYKIFPTNSWQERDVYKDVFRIKVPSAFGVKNNLNTYLKREYVLKIGFFEHENGLQYKVRGPVDSQGRAYLARIK